MIDTHCHYLHPDFDSDREEILQAVWGHGVTALLEVGYTPKLAHDALLWARRDTRVKVVAGIHPHETGRCTAEDLDVIACLAEDPDVLAVGETGLDFYRDRAPRDRQEEVFRQMIRLSRKLRKPLVLHIRDAYSEAIRILEEEGGGEFGGVFHCFQGDAATARRARELGFMLGLGGTITYWSASRRKVIHDIPIEAMLLETDAPWLCPAPWRGQRNDSRYLVQVVEVIAAVTGLDDRTIVDVTTANARGTFPGLGMGAAGAESGGRA
ncbi:MAG: TatD family hydrolase [Candidatus Eisenbacteria bacterium]|nr:TatD family hydrolase [Candidatus Eisenbacteria bacterium]